MRQSQFVPGKWLATVCPPPICFMQAGEAYRYWLHNPVLPGRRPHERKPLKPLDLGRPEPMDIGDPPPPEPKPAEDKPE